MDEWMDGRMGGRVYGRTDVRTDRQTDGYIERRGDGWVVRWVGGCLNS